jgi:hypothetical protein
MELLKTVYIPLGIRQMNPQSGVNVVGNVNLSGVFRFSVEETLIFLDIILLSSIDGLTPWRRVIFEKPLVA